MFVSIYCCTRGALYYYSREYSGISVRIRPGEPDIFLGTGTWSAELPSLSVYRGLQNLDIYSPKGTERQAKKNAERRVLLIDKCHFTLLGFREELARYTPDVKCFNPGTRNDIQKLISRNKYGVLIIGFEYFVEFNLSEDIKDIIMRNNNVKIIIISGMNWPLRCSPLKLSHNVYFACRRDLSVISSLLKTNTIKDYFCASIPFCCSPQEHVVLKMIMNKEGRGVICRKLKIKGKTLSSHIVNIKRKVSARSVQQIIRAYIVKYCYLEILSEVT